MGNSLSSANFHIKFPSVLLLTRPWQGCLEVSTSPKAKDQWQATLDWIRFTPTLLPRLSWLGVRCSLQNISTQVPPNRRFYSFIKKQKSQLFSKIVIQRFLYYEWTTRLSQLFSLAESFIMISYKMLYPSDCAYLKPLDSHKEHN